jgi:TolB-like protein
MTVVYLFGPFRLDAEPGTLFRAGEPVAVGQRAVAVLRLLVSAAGVPISKEALIGQAWPRLAVEESNLTVQIAALRRVFERENGGERWIETLPRRGYRYVGPPVTVQEHRGDAGTDAAVTTSPALPDRPSIAVLPFNDLSGDPDQAYFADGVVEDIITGLSRIKWLFVIARNSSFVYKGRPVNVRDVGRELGVRYLLEGSVRRADQRVRISAQLIEAESASHIWAERYDRPLDDIFALQDEITLNVVGAIEPSLRDAEVERVRRKRPENLDAYDLVLRALPKVSAAMPAEAADAIPLLERALTIEPDYAIAHGFLAWCHEIFFVRGGFGEHSRNEAIRHARAAMAHGHDDATALALGGFIMALANHDQLAAFDAFEQALAVSPSSSLALSCGAVALAYAGEIERPIEWARRALRISPLDRLNNIPHHALAIAHFLRGDYQESANAARRAAQIQPSFSVSYCLLAAAQVKLERLDQAKAAAQQALVLEPSFSAGDFCVALGLPAAVAGPLTRAWLDAGLPE